MAIFPTNPPHPIIIVTGANSGVGFGISHRLLVQLSRSCPEDALPGRSRKEKWLQTIQPSPFAPTKRVTLILACRSLERAAAARERLLDLIDAEVSRQKKSAHAEEFRRGLRIDCIQLDLTSMESIFDFAEDVGRRYSYITHLILNAGLLFGTGLDYVAALKQFLTNPMAAFTTPRYIIQKLAIESPDGLGLVWQSNVFGNYSLSRLLGPFLLRNPYLDSRVEWMSSLDAATEDYDPTDIQLRRTKFPYQASKHQLDILCVTLARAVARSPPNGTARIRHLLVHPGVCHSGMGTNFVNVFVTALKIFMFYLVRLLGSGNHPVKPYKGAVAASYAALAPGTLMEELPTSPPRKYGSKTTIWGKEFVDMSPIPESESTVSAGEYLLKYCDELFTKYEKRRGA